VSEVARLSFGDPGLPPRADAGLCPPQIKFKQGTVQTPELLQDVEIPESVTVLGQAVDLSALKSALQPVTSSLQSAVEQVRRSLDSNPFYPLLLRLVQLVTVLVQHLFEFREY